MSPVADLLLSLLVAALILAAVSKPSRKAVGGWISRDKKGRLTIALTPAKKRKRKGKR